jgi:hypothetical protein
VALIFPLFQVIRWEVLQAQADRSSAVNVQGLGTLSLTPGKAQPDVYFIVVDMYTRHDVLSEVYQYDNTPFLDSLRDLGFLVVDCSQSNYSQTEMVLASTLNMSYLDQMGDLEPSTKGSSDLRHWIQDNSVMGAFKTLGYKLVAFETGYPFSEFQFADYYLSPESGITSHPGRMNTFEALFLKTTLSLALTDFAQTLPPVLVPDTSQPLETKRQQVLYDLQQLENIPHEIPGPKFIFAHILALHEPYVFSADGQAATFPENMNTEQNYAAYRDQVEFINNRLVTILQNIIQHSDPRPIIILQGDTGPGLVSHSGRMANLSAFYLPGYEQSITPGLTPVNNFRLVFDQYFGANLGMLPDRSNFSLYTSPYDFESIPNDCLPPPEE